MRTGPSDPQLDRLRQLLSSAAGLVFDDSRRSSLAYSLAERMRATGLRDVEAYLARLADPAELQELLDEVTIQETHFFRNPPQVRALREHVLPELLRRAAATDRRLRVWSAGCSTGEEAYTVAMLLHELLPAADGWDVTVLGTDVSERALATARTGRYGARALQLAGRDDVARFFRPVPAGGHEVRPEVRDLVTFAHHNLVTAPPPFGPGEVDLVLCRNVTIYFARETTRALMGRVHGVLRDGGYLFLGHAETLWQVSDDFRLVALGSGEAAAFVYRRQDPQPDRRVVVPDRRTADEGFPSGSTRRRAPRRHADVPVTAEALLARARARLAEGAYDAAAELCAQAGRLDPVRGEAFYLRGLALVDAGRDAEALPELRRAVYLQPLHGFAHFLLAGVLCRLGDRPAAAREYAAAAATLGGSEGDGTAPELGGRSVEELAALCRRLAALSGAGSGR